MLLFLVSSLIISHGALLHIILLTLPLMMLSVVTELRTRAAYGYITFIIIFVDHKKRQPTFTNEVAHCYIQLSPELFIPFQERRLFLIFLHVIPEIMEFGVHR